MLLHIHSVQRLLRAGLIGTYAALWRQTMGDDNGVPKSLSSINYQPSSNMAVIVSIQQRQDLRSLAFFRFLLGLYVVYDVVSRLKHGHLSILWYTSSPGSFLQPQDSPHGNPIHKVWFYRGDVLLESALFLSTSIAACAFAVGLKCNVVLKVVLWLLVVAMQNRNMNVHDGSDTYTRHLLLWSCQLPMAQVWSLDSMIDSRRGTTKKNAVQPHDSAVWGLRLQIVLMYVGTVLNRTTDAYGWSVGRSTWMPPQLSAVHYSLNSSFANRDCWLGDLVRTTFPLSQIMTFSAMMIEGIAPIACMLFGNYAHIPAFLLFTMHLGLLILINLPNWQFVGMLATTVWIPSSVWDGLQRRLALRFPRHISPPQIVGPFETKPKNDAPMHHPDQKPPLRRSRRRPFLSYFLLGYMIYNFSGERKWIAKHDGGDIGEFLRFSQYWVMFGTAPVTSVHTILVGKFEGLEVDVWEWIRKGHVKSMDLEVRQSQIWSNMTHIYPSPRWERIFDQWGERQDMRRGRYFLSQLCDASPFQDLTLIWQHLVVMPPNSITRFRRSALPDTVIHVVCDSRTKRL